MRNYLICGVLLFLMAGTACSKATKPLQQGYEKQAVGDEAKTLNFDLGSGVTLEMVLIPAGEFLMGSPTSDDNAGANEKPQHRVRITRPFYLGKYLITQEQWKAVMGNNPSVLKGAKNPVENINWDDGRRFLDKLNAGLGPGEGKFQLPTEAQWEYACRAGTTTRYCFGDDPSGLGQYAWFGENSGLTTHPAGEKKPNAWGLYDMHGNVGEWCADWYGGGYYAVSPTNDPTGPTSGVNRVVRGGTWNRDAARCRSAHRYFDFTPVSDDYYQGFRVSLVPADKSGE